MDVESTGEAAEKLIHLDNMLVRITQQDVVYRRYLDPAHRSFIPDFGVYIKYEENGKIEYRALSRQLVMFCVERRKSWRMLQSKAGIVNKEYAAQKAPVSKRPAQLHAFSTSNVTLDTQSPAGFDAPDCGRVVAVAAGHFSPEIPIPAIW